MVGMSVEHCIVSVHGRRQAIVVAAAVATVPAILLCSQLGRL